jgi:hypothetical protein
MRTLLVVAASVIVSLACTALVQGGSAPPAEVGAIGSYVCPNHPDIRATWSARCPICQAVLAEVQGVDDEGDEGEGFGDEGFEGEGYGNEGFGGEGYEGEGFGNEGFGGEGYEGEGFGNEGFGGEGYEGEGFGNEGFGGEGYEGEGFGNEGFGGEGYEGEGFGNEGFGGEGFGGEGDEGGMSRIAAMPEAAPPLRIGDQYFCPRCGMPLRDIQVSTTQGQDQSQGTLGNNAWLGQPPDQQYGGEDYPFYSGSQYGTPGDFPPDSSNQGYIPPSYPAQPYGQGYFPPYPDQGYDQGGYHPPAYPNPPYDQGGYFPPYPDQGYGQGEYPYPPGDEYGQTYPQDQYGEILNELNRLFGGGEGSAPNQ